MKRAADFERQHSFGSGILAQGTSPFDRLSIPRDDVLIVRIEVGDDSYVLIIARFSTTTQDLLDIKTYIGG